jgi:hypothetical protein
MGVDRSLGIVLVAVDREAFSLLPALHGSNVPPEVAGDFLPGI